MTNKSLVSKLATKAVEKSEPSQKAPLFLDQLELDVTGTIVVMIGRIWDVNAITGRYLSTDFVVSDSKGNMIHCSAKSNVAHNFLRMKEGGIYAVKNFVVVDEYRILSRICSCLSLMERQQHERQLPSTVRHVDYPVFRLEVVVADDTAHTVVVMFNDTTTELIKCSAKSLMVATMRGRMQMPELKDSDQDEVSVTVDNQKKMKRNTEDDSESA
nr:hypothetical protein [Tanacetum cinerariifolium]GEY36764.1 hypothetical protein [Tanacetum cinerariifolium]